MSKLTVIVTAFRPLHRNTLRGFCNVYIAELHLVVRDVAVHEYASGGRWVVLPARPVVDNGVVRLTDAGKIEYAQCSRSTVAQSAKLSRRPLSTR